MKIHNFEQQTPEWYQVRKLKMTASNAQAVGNGKVGLETYILGLVASHYSKGEQFIYTNKDLERGVELEPLARQMYELEKKIKVEQVGFVEIDEHLGCSPDGFVGKDGGIEIKCPNDFEHFKIVCKGQSEVDTKYIWQVQMNLLLTKRKWWDLVFYNPNFHKSLIIFRIKPDKEKQKKLREGIKKGKQLIKMNITSYEKSL